MEKPWQSVPAPSRGTSVSLVSPTSAGNAPIESPMSVPLGATAIQSSTPPPTVLSWVATRVTADVVSARARLAELAWAALSGLAFLVTSNGVPRRGPAEDEGPAFPEGWTVEPAGGEAVREERDPGPAERSVPAEANAPASTPRLEATITIATDIARAPGPRPTARCIAAGEGVEA